MDESQLVAAALEARDRAYAPYSQYKVGAALLSESGKLYRGCNVENASYGLTICAERTALVKAVSEGETRFTALAVATDGGASLCGACRQFLREFGADIVVLLADLNGEYRKTDITALLPGAFAPEALDP